MADYGMQIFNKSGTKILDTSDELGRFIGVERIFPIPQRRRATFRFDKSSYNQYGQIFIWTNPDFNYGFEGDISITVTNGVINVSLFFTPVGDDVGQNNSEILIYYGVK